MIKSFFKAAAREHSLPRVLGKTVARAAFAASLFLVLTGCVGKKPTPDMGWNVPVQSNGLSFEVKQNISAVMKKHEEAYGGKCVVIPYQEIKKLKSSIQQNYLNFVDGKENISQKERVDFLRKGTWALREIARDLEGNKIEPTLLLDETIYTVMAKTSESRTAAAYSMGHKNFLFVVPMKKTKDGSYDFFSVSDKEKALIDYMAGEEGFSDLLSQRELEEISALIKAHEFSHGIDPKKDKNVLKREIYADITGSEIIHEATDSFFAATFIMNARARLATTLYGGIDHCTTFAMRDFLSKQGCDVSDYPSIKWEEFIEGAGNILAKTKENTDAFVLGYSEKVSAVPSGFSKEAINFEKDVRNHVLSQLRDPSVYDGLSASGKKVADFFIQADSYFDKMMGRVPQPTSPYQKEAHANLPAGLHFTN